MELAAPIAYMDPNHYFQQKLHNAPSSHSHFVRHHGAPRPCHALCAPLGALDVPPEAHTLINMATLQTAARLPGRQAGIGAGILHKHVKRCAVARCQPDRTSQLSSRANTDGNVCAEEQAADGGVIARRHIGMAMALAAVCAAAPLKAIAEEPFRRSDSGLLIQDLR